MVAATGCGRPLPVVGPTPPGEAIVLPCCAVEGAPVELLYTGVGGWLVRRGDDAILFAPLFSNPSLLRAGLGTVAPDSARIESALERLDLDLADVDLILSGHGHYDHLLDVPYLMERHARGARLLANATSAHQIASAELGARVVVVDDGAGDVSAPGRWIRQGNVRVMAFRSRHAPHFEGLTLYEGRRGRDLRELPAAVHEWLDGETVSFLVDFLEGDRVAFRLYYQDAVAAEPLGLVPEALLRGADGRAVDAAIVVPSTFDEVPWHPEAVVENLRPRHVLVGHWEDFFRPPLQDPEPLFLEDFSHFLGRLERALGAVGAPGEAWHMPAPGTRFLVRRAPLSPG